MFGEIQKQHRSHHCDVAGAGPAGRSRADMRNLKVWQKLALMGIVFMIPFAGVTYKMTSSINALGVDFARQEVVGLEYYTPVSVLMKDLQLHRDIANSLLLGDVSLSDRLARKRVDVENDIKALDEVDARLQ